MPLCLHKHRRCAFVHSPDIHIVWLHATPILHRASYARQERHHLYNLRWYKKITRPATQEHHRALQRPKRDVQNLHQGPNVGSTNKTNRRTFYRIIQQQKSHLCRDDFFVYYNKFHQKTSFSTKEDLSPTLPSI